MQSQQIAPTAKTDHQAEDTERMPSSDPRSEIISIDPERVSGTPCFVGTRVPVKTLFDYLEGGESVEDFLDGFPGISREQVVKTLQMAFTHLLDGLPKA